MSSSEAAKPEKQKALVGSLAHGLNIIMAFDRANPAMTMAQVAEKTGMDRAGARRYLLTLVHLGFMEQTGRLFRLTPKVMDLGYSYLSSVPLAEKAQYYLDTIRDHTGLPVALGILDGLQVVHVASANSDDFISPGLTIGRRFDIAYASAGRAILAEMPDNEREAILGQIELKPTTEHSIATLDALRTELDRVRVQGFALVDQEMTVGIRSLAVPIFNPKGEAVASFNTYTFSSIVSREKLISEALPALKEAAQKLQLTLT